MDKDAKIYIAGHTGMVGQAMLRQLRIRGHHNVVLRTSRELDLTQQSDVQDFFSDERPDFVFNAAAVVGGIKANVAYPADFLVKNLIMQTNLIDAAYRSGTKKLLFLGSSCVMPRAAPQPMKEEYLLTSPLEATNEWYAIAKIAGIKMCQSYRRQYGFDAISALPTNLFGIDDNFDLDTSHVPAALIRKMHDAKTGDHRQVVIWGTGKPRREFMFADDMADACVFLMNNYDKEQFVNVGVGSEISIADFAELVARVVGYGGRFVFDPKQPDGVPRKLLDVSRLNSLGWKSQVTLQDGLERTYSWFLENEDKLHRRSPDKSRRA